MQRLRFYSQLLEVLLEFNDSIHVSPQLRYELTAPGERPSRLPSPAQDDGNLPPFTTETADRVLAEARAELSAGEITAEDYQRYENAVKRSKAFQPAVKYSVLLQQPHTPASKSHVYDDHEHPATTLGYMTPEHERDFYLLTDAGLGDPDAVLQLSQSSDKPSPADREREASLRNPISVYNWLRRNQPQIFLQDNEVAAEKPTASKPANVRSSKRKSTQVSSPPRREEDMYDEDGIALEIDQAPSGSKNKRKRDDDTGYRPKGGTSGRSSKKKKDDGKRSKRSSAVGS